MEASIESKRKEEKELHEKDIAAHRRLRDATAAAAVESKQCIEDCKNNLKYLKKQVCQNCQKINANKCWHKVFSSHFKGAYTVLIVQQSLKSILMRNELNSAMWPHI